MALLRLLALVEFLVPRRLVALAESVAVADRGEATLRSWTVPMARAEGLAFLLLSRRETPVTRQLAPLFGLLGLPMVLAPRRVLDAALGIAYDRADDIELRAWVVPVTRLLGGAYLLVALRALVGGRNRPEATEVEEAT